MSKANIPKRVKKAVAERAGLRCEYCKAPKLFAPSPFNVDHIVPEAEGGDSEFDNLAFACENCNLCKADKVFAIDPDTGSVAPLFHPRKDTWTKHFEWKDDDILIYGITPEGRATVTQLQMNHQAVVNMRMLLKMVGEHPPKYTDGGS